MLAQVTALFFDMGGVLLTNGWDRESRRAAAKKFDLDWDDFEDRHELLLHAFEVGELSLNEYLKRVVFYRERAFGRQEFIDFIYSQSRAMPETLAVLGRLAAMRKYLMGALNNESRDLNEYRIRQFDLRKYFDVFLSSCYLGVRKPDEAMYKLALSITQRAGEECVFIDDRALNLECARELGMHTIQFKDAGQLEKGLRGFGVELGAGLSG
ncbi:MAG: HAD family hydrolase [Candidatus Acidiferrales bacterium]